LVVLELLDHTRVRSLLGSFWAFVIIFILDFSKTGLSRLLLNAWVCNRWPRAMAVELLAFCLVESRLRVALVAVL
jgi:hypothetical protein